MSSSARESADSSTMFFGVSAKVALTQQDKCKEHFAGEKTCPMACRYLWDTAPRVG